MDTPGKLKTVCHCLSAICIYTFSFSTIADTFLANGSLSTPDGIDGLASWGSGPANLTWDIAHFEGQVDTRYTYTFEHIEAATFEFIIEVHPNMVTSPDPFAKEIYQVNINGLSSTNYELGFFTPGTSFPGMPETMPGVRFWGNSGGTTETISFSSDYYAMWGDFYATDSSAAVAAWNSGFTNPDIDPSQRASDGSVDYHLLVPGAGGMGIIPIPPAIWLFGSGLIGLTGLARCKRT